jgi:FAD/FMN-containing dehydrogenase
MLIDTLKEIVGDKGWSLDADVLEPHLNEWRGDLRGKTLIMVSPRTTAEVSAVVRACAAANVGLVPQGGNTSLCGGSIPDESGEQVLLSLSRLNTIREVDADDFSMVVDAGCILADVQEAAQQVDRLYPLSLGAEGTCQIGGNLSTNAGGINVIRYGTARQQVLGLEVVLADGTIWDGLRSLRKDAAGYDMKQLFIGSEGTLGIITAATLKLYPQPGETTTVFAALHNATQAVSLLGLLRKTLADGIQAFELISARCVQLVEKHIPNAQQPFEEDYPWFVLCEVIDTGQDSIVENAFAAAMEDGLVSDAVIAKSSVEAEKFWRLRHSIAESEKQEGAHLHHDISVPIARMDEFLTRAEEVVHSVYPTARLVTFGHVGDGNLHYNVAQPADEDGETFLAASAPITEAIYDLVAEMGGSFSAEHGVGIVKKRHLHRYRSETELDLMRAMKSALDPNNILNPGRVI